jgi:DNA primase
MARYEGAIKSSFKVVTVSGDEYQVICPWHSDHSGHLYINATKGLYLCMVCGAKGSLEKLAIRPTVLGSDDVREKIARMATKHDPVTIYPESWLKKFDVKHDYWTEVRHLPEDTIDRFGLGYDFYSDRMTIPLRDQYGKILGVTYRRLDDRKPKYLHPKGFPTGKHLFGAWLVTDERRVALVEGQVDAIRCWSERVPALGLMGARLTIDQRKVLQRLDIQTVVLMMDNDAAGYRGTIGVAESLEGSGIRVLVGRYLDYWYDEKGEAVKDPDGLNGARLRKMYHSAGDIYKWSEDI